MDYPAPKLMGFHFPKHLSLLVLASEREMRFDSAALCVTLGAAAPVPVAALHRAARGGSRWMGGLAEGLGLPPEEGQLRARQLLLRAAPPAVPKSGDTSVSPRLGMVVPAVTVDPPLPPQPCEGSAGL